MDNKKSKPLFHENHKKPITRRDFLAQGFIEGAGYLAVPSLLQLMFNEKIAHAANCPGGGTIQGNHLANITIDMAGGAALAGGNFAMVKNGKNINSILANYNRMGQYSSATAPGRSVIDTRYGAPVFRNTMNVLLDARFIAGMESIVTDEATRNKITIATAASASQNDTETNTHSPTGLIASLQSAMQGVSEYETLVRRIGTSSTRSGANSRAFQDALLPPAQRIVKAADITASLKLALGFTSMAEGQQRSVLDAVSKRAGDDTFRKLAGEKDRKFLHECAVKNKSQTLADTYDVVPSANPAMLQVYGGNAALADGAQGTIIYNALKGNALSGTLELGGYDYHDGTRTTGNDRDFIAGAVLGRIILAASLLGVPVFVAVISDGSVYSSVDDDNNPRWLGDRQENGCALMVSFNPNGPATLARFQVGSYNEPNQAVNRSEFVSQTTDNLAVTLAANYFYLQQKGSENIGELISKVAPSVGAIPLKDILVYG